MGSGSPAISCDSSHPSRAPLIDVVSQAPMPLPSGQLRLLARHPLAQPPGQRACHRSPRRQKLLMHWVGHGSPVAWDAVCTLRESGAPTSGSGTTEMTVTGPSRCLCSALCSQSPRQTGIKLAEIAFLLILIAGVWLVAAKIPALRLQRVRTIVAGAALAVAGAQLIIATHWGHFG